MSASAQAVPTPVELEKLARRVRRRILALVYSSGSGHVGGALSEADVLVALYARFLNIRPEAPRAALRDRFVLSKGHGGLGLCAVLAELGFLDDAALAGFGQTGEALGMHMDWRRVPGIEVSTGSLGHGLGVAVGMALGARTQGHAYRTACLLSDGECYEGSTWEAAQAAATFRLGRLCAVVDRNRLTMDGFTEDEAPLEPLADKWTAFGWRVLACDGHDFSALVSALETAWQAPLAAPPTVIIAETVKGKGVPFMENKVEWHYGALDSERYQEALLAIGQ